MTDGSASGFFLILIIVLVGTAFFYLRGYLRRRKREKEDKEAVEAGVRRLEELVPRFGQEAAYHILDEEHVLGMTKEMLLEAWGEPHDVDEEVSGAKVRQTWKYDQVGVNRYRDRVSLENDVVVGWKSHRMDIAKEAQRRMDIEKGVEE
jgi:hypothetical protein